MYGNYFQNIFPKISGSQEDKQISIFGCPHSFFGRRGHEDTRILLPWKESFAFVLDAVVVDSAAVAKCKTQEQSLGQTG